MESVYLGLGSNLGNRQDNLEEAVWRLSRVIAVQLLSSMYDTAPVGEVNQPRFLNMALKADTALSPAWLLQEAQRIEREMGRQLPSHDAPRPIDIDILFYGSEIINTDELVIPHPRVAERAFVLVPLVEIAPQIVHPLSGKSVSEMLAALSYSPEEVIKIPRQGNCIFLQ